MAGPSGSGKGTQKDLLSKAFNLPSASMGELLRAEAKLDTERAELVKGNVVKGLHVDNNITNDLIFEWLNQHGAKGYIIEGYPRNPEQFEYLNERETLTHVIVLEISDATVRERILGRRVCPCGGNYHMKYKPPKHNETCDNCGEQLQIRADSTPEATEKRIRLYHEEMVPVIEAYKEFGIVHLIDGEQPIEQVHQDILKAFTYEKK